MDAIERAVPAPQIEIIVRGRAWRQVFRNRAPLAARAQDVHQLSMGRAISSLWGVQFSPLGGSAISRLNDQDLRVLVADHGA